MDSLVRLVFFSIYKDESKYNDTYNCLREITFLHNARTENNAELLDNSHVVSFS